MVNIRSAAAVAYMTLLRQRGGVSVENTVAPSISILTPNVGDVLALSLGTWTGSPSLSGELRHEDTQDVILTVTADDTYTALDTDFGHALRLYVIPNGDAGAAVASAATARVAEVPVQSLGSELLTNGDFSAWSGDNPTGWTVTGETGSSRQVTQDGNAARFVSDANNAPRITQAVLSLGTFYELVAVVSAYVSGTRLSANDGGGGIAINATSVGTRRTIGRASATTSIGAAPTGTPPFDISLDEMSVKLLTLNAQLTTPSADMRLDFFYALPGSPVEGTTVWLLPRISDFANGNYWLGFLRYTGSQWDVNLYSVATHTRTSRIAASNIGATNGLRVNMNGTGIELFTTANGGGAWTSRGTFTSSTYQSAAGVNVLHTSDITPGNLEYAPAA